MVLVPYPAPTSHQSVSLQPITSSLVNSSKLTGARQAIDVGYSWWTADIVVTPMRLENALKWRLFFGRARGPVNSFRVPVAGAPQHSGSFTVRAQGAGSGYSLLTDGWPASSLVLQAGEYVTVGDQLMVLDADVVTSAGGTATLRFHSPLRGAVADNTVIETKNPFLRAYLPEGSPALTLTLAHIQDGFSFSVMEAY